MLPPFSFIRLVSSKGVYEMHPLIHAWGRDEMSPEDKQKYCLIAYVMLACSVPKYFNKQPYLFRRILVTHVRANIQYSLIENMDMIDRFFEGDHEKVGRLLGEQGYDGEAEKFQIHILDVKSRTFGEEHPDTISVIGDLANTYESLGKYADAERLQIKVLELRSRYFGEENPDTIWAMSNLAVTYKSLGKYPDADTLEIKVLDLRKRYLGEEHPDTIIAMNSLAKKNIQDSWKICKCREAPNTSSGYEKQTSWRRTSSYSFCHE